MHLMGFSHPARWLVVPATLMAMVLVPVRVGLLADGLLVLMVIVGYVEQGIHLGDLTDRARWISVVVAPLVFAVLLIGRIQWLVGALSYEVLVVLGLAALCGYMVGSLLASLRSSRVVDPPISDDLVSDPTEDLTTPVEVFRRANEATVIRDEQPVALPQRVDPRRVEVLVDGVWQRATLDAWETRDLGLHGHVTLWDVPSRVGWVPADLLRAVDDPIASSPDEL